MQGECRVFWAASGLMEALSSAHRFRTSCDGAVKVEKSVTRPNLTFNALIFESLYILYSFTIHRKVLPFATFVIGIFIWYSYVTTQSKHKNIRSKWTEIKDVYSIYTLDVVKERWVGLRRILLDQSAVRQKPVAGEQAELSIGVIVLVTWRGR